MKDWVHIQSKRCRAEIRSPLENRLEKEVKSFSKQLWKSRVNRFLLTLWSAWYTMDKGKRKILCFTINIGHTMLPWIMGKRKKLGFTINISQPLRWSYGASARVLSYSGLCWFTQGRSPQDKATEYLISRECQEWNHGIWYSVHHKNWL